MKIYLKLDKKPKTVRELLKILFSSYFSTQQTHNVATYFDEQCTKTQCTSNRLRSFDDIFDIVHTYFPTVSDKTIFKYLLTLDVKSKVGTTSNLHIGSCGGIKRIRVLYYTGTSDNCTSLDRILNQTKYDSKYSMRELFNMINIKTQEEFTALISVKK